MKLESVSPFAGSGIALTLMDEGAHRFTAYRIKCGAKEHCGWVGKGEIPHLNTL
jgi:hypothetical protein